MSKYELSNNQIYVLKLLLQSRGLTLKQIVRCFYGHVGMEFALERKGNIHNLLTRLIKRGYVIKERSGKQMKRNELADFFYFLTEDGLEYIENRFNVHLHKRGSGFDDDYSSIPYDLYKVAIASEKNVQVEHTYYTREVFSLLMMLNNLNELNFHLANIRSDDNLKFDYHDILASPSMKKDLTNIRTRSFKDNRTTNFISFRNNLYCAPPKGEVAYKPDGEIEVEGLRYPLEIDTGSERGNKLEDKFEKLQERLHELKESKLALPKGIIFILKTQSEISTYKKPTHNLINRFRNINEHFLEKNQSFLSEVALHVISIYDLEDFILSMTAQHIRNMQTKFQTVLNEQYAKGDAGLEWKTFESTKQFYFTSYKSQFYLYGIIEGSNTQTWHKLQEARTALIDKIESQTGTRPTMKTFILYKNIVPIFPKVPKNLKGFEREFFDNVLLVQLKANQLNWYDSEYRAIDFDF